MTYVERRVERDDASCCPFCGHGECTLQDTDYINGEYSELYTCDRCGRDFNEVYGYKFTEYWEEKR